MKISIIIPLYNEEDNIAPLGTGLLAALEKLPCPFEIILVNDGSTDNTAAALDTLAVTDPRIRVAHLRRNYGQTAAMMAGIDLAEGDIIIPMDGDLQNDPGDIPALLAKLDEGYDVVSGWRQKRRDNPIRVIPSKIANGLISLISGVKLNDYGCSLKAYRREVIKDVRLYGEMHRFIPIYASWEGARVTQIPVNHHPRIHGKSKYGMKRTIKVILDLVVIKFLAAYFHRPIYVFGGFGMLSFFGAFLTALGMIWLKYWGHKTFIQTPLPMVLILFILVGIISVFIGLLSQVIMMTYYESQGKKSYAIARTHNIGKES